MKNITKIPFSKKHFYSAVQRSFTNLLTSSLLSILIVQSAFTQSVEDFRIASQNSGVDAIPFKELRQEASSISEEVNQRKGEVQKFNYTSIEKQKFNLLKEVQKTEQNIADIDKTIADLKKGHKEIDVSSFERDKSKLQDELRGNLNSVSAFNEEKIAPAIEAFKRLWNARGGLRDVFKVTLDKLKIIESKPEDILGNDANEAMKSELLKNVETIMKNISGEVAKTHKNQEDGAIGTQQQYEELLRRNSL